MTDIVEGDVYVSSDYNHRRVIALFGLWVYYSVGGDRTEACRLSLFSRWIETTKAVKYEETKRGKKEAAIVHKRRQRMAETGKEQNNVTEDQG